MARPAVRGKGLGVAVRAGSGADVVFGTLEGFQASRDRPGRAKLVPAGADVVFGTLEGFQASRDRPGRAKLVPAGADASPFA